MKPTAEQSLSRDGRLAIVPSAFLSLLLVSACASTASNEEERRIRLFLAPGTMGLSLLAPRGGWKGIQTLANERKLRAAASQGDNEELQKRLALGADINARNDEGWTALALAVNGGHLDTTKLLLSRARHSWQEPTIEVRNETLAIAVQNSGVAMVRLLLDKDASPDASNELGETVLMRAASVGSPQIMQMLLDAGADPNAVDAQGNGVAYWARKGNCTECPGAGTPH